MTGPPIVFVVTTINAPTPGIQTIAKRLPQGCRFIVIGDRKTHAPWSEPGVEFYSIDDQSEIDLRCSTVIPENSYSRKMLGYLLAANLNCTWIRETDDDNLPYETFFDLPPDVAHVRVPLPVNDWVNIYSYFTERFVWPRGFPLHRLHDPGRTKALCSRPTSVSQPIIVQSLADGDPDVDAIYRLTAPTLESIAFESREPLLVPRGAWSPFNSQVTTWHRDLLPLMYLPSTCSFRMTDIWRSFVAQRLLPGLGGSLVVTSAEVFQARNEHDLMRDFRDEIEGYVGYESFVSALNLASITGTASSLIEDMRIIYRDLVNLSFFAEDELPILDAWLYDVAAVGWTA